ncbi:glycosyltransferase [Brucella pituitosa]|uniref:glycosyltransferase n=1 Tax=Brucella pituitosa TaxID=571256 RepID=UPI003F4AAD3B
MAVEISYWLKSENIQNFGDFLSEFFLEELFYPLGFPGRIHIVGSVIDNLFIPGPDGDQHERVWFWGAGVREKDAVTQEYQNLASILSVRGRLSASELRLGDSVPIGDPAFLIPALYTPKIKPQFKGKSVCIPHFHDNRKDEEIKNLTGCDVVLRPNIPNNTAEIRRFIDAIYSCEFVLAGAMHGAIIAAAYKKQFAYWDSEKVDLPFKWQDLSDSLGIQTAFCKDIKSAKKHYKEQIAPSIKIPSLWGALALSPLLVRPSALLKVAKYELSELASKEVISSFDELIAGYSSNLASSDRIAGIISNKITYDSDLIKSLQKKTISSEKEFIDRVFKFKNELEELRLQISDLKLKNSALEARADKDVASALRQSAVKASEIEVIRSQLNEKDAQILSLYNSTSWKITSPIRSVMMRSPESVRRFFRKSATAVWWIATLQFRRLAKRVFSNNSGQVAASAVVDTNALQELPSVSHAVPLSSEDPFSRIMAGGDWSKPVVLIIDSIFPRPDKDSGSIDALNFVKSFQRIGYQVIFLASNAPEDAHYKTSLEKMGVICVSQNEHQPIDAFFRRISHIVDLCFLSRVDVGGAYIETLKRTFDHAKIIFNTVDLHHIREERQARLAGDRVGINRALATREREYAVIALADASIVVSEEEQKILAYERPGALVEMIPLARDCPGRINPYLHRAGIGFVGSFQHAPNLDAVKYFLDFIWPLVRSGLPDVDFYVIGASMPDELRERTDSGLVCVGYVDDLTEQLERLRLTVAPLRFGAGVKGKVASSLAHGVPCVATELAAEGMGLNNGETIAVGKTPEEFAQLIVDLYKDQQKWTRASDAGIAHISTNYSFDRCHNLLVKLLAEIGAPVTEDFSSKVDANKVA